MIAKFEIAGFGSLADISQWKRHVCFTPESGHQVLNQMQHRHCHAYGKQDDGNNQGD
jgi:hypothetical protein